MKHYKFLFIQLTVCCLLLAGCDNYLDITPKGKKLLTTVDDYDQWLNSESLVYGVGQASGSINYLGDNLELINMTNPPTKPGELMYIWSPQFSFDINAAPELWGAHYAQINLYNTVLTGIDDATGGSNVKKRSLKAEALLGRALEYFYLVNEYAKPYDPVTAEQDLAVPFVTTNDVTSEVPPRSTTAAIYKHIIDDINTAIPDLPVDNSLNRLRGSLAAGYSLLARVYFYQRNYPEAQKNAELALANTKAVMIDFNGTLPATNIMGTHPDVIYGRILAVITTPTLDFIQSFARNDLRVKKLYIGQDTYPYTKRGLMQFYPEAVTAVFKQTNAGTSVQEMKLIAAEGAARSNNLTLALKYLDEIRQKRIEAATYERFESSDQETVLKEVLQERAHELPYNGLRWFDMRRLDKENRMPAVYRYNAQGEVIATLEPHSERYTLQIPVQVLSFNPGMQQN